MPYDITCLTPIKIEDRAIIAPWVALERQQAVRMHYLEFRLLTQLQWILRGKEKSPVARIARNMGGLAALLFSRDKILIVGTEPFRYFTFLLNFLKGRHRCIWHGSWPWDLETFSRGPLRKLKQRAWQRFLADTICVCATRPAAEALAGYGARVFYIPWPVDTEIFQPAPGGNPAAEIRVLFVGELWKLKGVHLIMNIIRREAWPGVRFVMAGKGPMEAEIKSLIAAGYPVEYLGFIRDRRVLAQTMQASHMLILPSIKLGDQEEKFGMVLTEAMACGIPVIASDCIGPRQVVDPGVNGILIPQNDAEALAGAIRSLAGDPARRAALGANGRRKALAEYDFKVVARQWMEVFTVAAGKPER
ncbi:MAG: glycosyltransferase family 4 protein [Kiritimatiellae bacterium]|nr:glycosyltransferase family 4 protein [Kiritimatiellia bacterium]